MRFVVGRRIVVFQEVVLEAAMVPWLEELDRRETVAREEIAELRDQVGELTSRLAEREDVLSRLQITREAMSEILSGDDTVSVAGAEAGAGEAEMEMEEPRLPAGSPVGGAADAAVGVLPGPYQDIVEVLQDAVHPMRAHHLCAALGLSTDKSKVEGFRSKLKRLVERGWLTEEGPGLFTPREALAAGGDTPEQAGSSAVRRRADVGSGSRP
ncbi:hypothetical protein O3Q52_16580 [Streptomyces sp. ActVer]|uniref:hypothetical protein n=1 Tax=Streptomyces sp. ActVer TaxID=3014558 RepID=UPI0022B5C733|nr:hypothetical protein [Streptomyces sp. ActVer]MCZ4509782.1 hypothetical protein [Streptomyces sp. ActVer]